ncbi:hypothetical protein WJX81_005520 [Elliptochloris bilobata]|uniref:Post-SET domain-containing protein n=1 Tax=Elliptochloris bilobata TaxID=381761 RepID=A0AAW1SIM0_9CHLO
MAATVAAYGNREERVCGASCPCGLDSAGRLHLDADGCFLGDTDELEQLVLSECGPACGCGPACPFRATQRGLAISVLLVQHASKGWVALAGAEVRRGAFVCLYAGEVISTPEASKRLAEYDHAACEQPSAPGHALLVVREVLPSGSACLRTNIDATRRGNAARFFNHDCGGGTLALTLVRCAGCPLPRAALFARGDLPRGAELTFRYGPPSAGGGRARQRRCACGAAACLGYLPSESV